MMKVFLIVVLAIIGPLFFNCCQYFTLIHIANIILSIIP